MAERQIDAAGLPTVTPPWLKQSQQKTAGQPQQQTQQRTRQPIIYQPQPNYFQSAAKLFSKPAGNFLKSQFFSSGIQSGVGGAASGALSAAGGSYVTGSGLAGTASAINTTAGAAGKSAAGGLTNGLKGGLASAGIGIAAGFLGDKIFGGYGGAGSSIGASVGFAAGGPLGAAIGGILGGAVGGLFGGDDKRTYFGVLQNGNAKSDRYYKKIETPLGYVGVYGTDGARSAIGPVQQAFVKSDKAVAEILDEDQLSRAKDLLANSSERQLTRWSQNPERAETIVERSIKWRYGKVSEAIDPAFGGVFNRVADKNNMAGLISTFAQLDRDIKNGSNLFAGKDVENGAQAISVIAETYGFDDKKPTPKTMGARPTELAAPTGSRPTPTAFGSYNNRQGGYIYRSGNSFYGQQPGWVRDPGRFGGQHDGYKKVLASAQRSWDLQKSKLNEANAKAQGAWEKQVLDAYVNNYQGNAVSGSVYNVANAGIERTNQDANLNTNGQTASTRTRLFGNVQQQEVKLNRAAPSSNAGTNAKGLLSRAGVI